MQINEPMKKVNWLFVIILIIGMPLIVVLLIMLNMIPV
jgi:hypothetical protein